MGSIYVLELGGGLVFRSLNSRLVVLLGDRATRLKQVRPNSCSTPSFGLSHPFRFSLLLLSGSAA